MTPENMHRLLMEVVSSALSYAASDIYIQDVAPNPEATDSSEMELKQEMLEKAVTAYAQALYALDDPADIPDMEEDANLNGL